MTEHLSDLALDAIRRTGATDGADHLAGCDACQARQARLTAADEDFAQRFVPAQLAVDTLAVPSIPKWSLRTKFAAVGFALAAAAVAFVVAPREQLRTKGGDALVTVHVRADGRTTPVRGPVDPRAHLAVQVKGPGFAQVLWSSRPGAWEPLYPPPGAPAWEVEASDWLPREVVLDGAPEDERLSAVVCPTAPSAADAAEIAGGADPGACRVQWVKIEKR